MKIFVKTGMVLLFSLTGLVAHAATCNVSATGITFSGYDVFSVTPNDSTGTITVVCDWPSPPPPTQPPLVSVSIGPSPTSGGFNPRQMRHPSRGDLLNYNLFTDTARSTVWGDGTGGTSSVSHRVTRNKPWVTTVYGRIPARQNLSAGLYSETLTVTIIW